MGVTVFVWAVRLILLIFSMRATCREFWSERNYCMWQSLAVVLFLVLACCLAGACIAIGLFIDKVVCRGFTEGMGPAGVVCSWFGLGLVTLCFGFLWMIIIVLLVGRICECIAQSWRDAQQRAQTYERLAIEQACAVPPEKVNSPRG